MRISCKWLGKYINLPENNELLIRTLTFSGIEVEGVETLSRLPESVVTARIENVEKIAGTDHLQVCSVDYGSQQHIQVVCGAPNCHAGMISVLALPETELANITIRKAKLHGVESNGMLCSERELGVSSNHAGIIELDPATPLGISANEIYELPDTVLELEITPNRSDLLGYLGIARDLAASLGSKVIYPDVKEFKGEANKEIDLTLILENQEKCPRYTARIIDGVTVKDSPQWLKTALIKSGLRPINNIVDITNFVMLETGHPLHAFDYNKLLPLNPDDGNPAIVVRNAKAGEEFLALDGKSYILDENDLVIADGSKASAIAGVIGGKDTSISSATKTIVLEAATFAPGSIRATAYKHKISTDSSYRFERHLSPVTPLQVSNRAVELIQDIAGGILCNAIYDAYPDPVKEQYLAIRPRRFEEVIGYKLDSESIKQYLEALGCKFIQYGTWQDGLVSDLDIIHCHHAEEEKAGVTVFSEIDCDHALYFSIPPYRVDLSREADLLEELARLAGYDRIPQKKAVSMIMDRHAHRIRRSIEDYFTDASFYETLNYSFSDPVQLAFMAFGQEELDTKLIRLINPQSSNQSAMRISLLPGLLADLSYNINHGERNLKLMEMGSIYLKEGSSYREPKHFTALMTGNIRTDHWKFKNEGIGFYHVKGLVEGLLSKLNLPEYETRFISKPWLVDADNAAFYCGNDICASVGRLKAEIAEKFGIDITVLKQDIWIIDIEVDKITDLTRERKLQFVPIPKYPSVIRDISFLIPQSVSYADIEKTIRANNPELIREVTIFDEYRGKQIPEGLHSISLHLLLQDNKKTLTDEYVDQLVDSVLNMLKNTWQIIMR